MTDKEKEIKRIAKLFALAEDDAASQGEIENALRMAQERMLRHNLTREDIKREGGEIDVSGITYARYPVFWKGKKQPRWLWSLTEFNKCFYKTVQCYRDTSGFYEVTTPEGGRTINNILCPGSDIGLKLYYYGPSDDALEAAMMHYHLQDVMLTLLEARFGSSGASGKGLDYALGFFRGLQEKNVTITQKLKDSSAKTTELILVSEKTELAIKEQAKNEIAHRFGVKLRKGVKLQSRKSFDHNMYQLGKRDGTNYDLEKPKAKRKRLK